MTPSIRILRAAPLTTLQDTGRAGLLRYGISASGPMDRGAFERAGGWVGGAGATGVEFTAAGLAFVVDGGSLGAAFDGGSFSLSIDGARKTWPTRAVLKSGTVVDITPGPAGNYGYVRFDREIDVPEVLGSRSTSSIAGLGGWQGRALTMSDLIPFGAAAVRQPSQHPRPADARDGPIRVIWGIHADVFDAETRRRFASQPFQVLPQLDRMGVRLRDATGVFAETKVLSLVSDAVVPGDIQILGDGTPIVLMRDHQPTGGYPRIATLISADFDRFAQLRPGTEVRFQPVTLAHAQEAKP
jgi:biotin-dependent carboxylase-like uncharacterized protein